MSFFKAPHLMTSHSLVVPHGPSHHPSNSGGHGRAATLNRGTDDRCAITPGPSALESGKDAARGDVSDAAMGRSGERGCEKVDVNKLRDVGTHHDGSYPWQLPRRRIQLRSGLYQPRLQDIGDSDDSADDDSGASCGSRVVPGQLAGL